MAGSKEEALELPEYIAATAPLLEPSSSSGPTQHDSVLRGSGIIRVDAIEYPITYQLHAWHISLPPKTVTSFLVDYNPNYHDFLDSVREQLDNESDPALDTLMFAGIRMSGKGPKLNETAWARIGSKIDHLELDLEMSQSERTRRVRVSMRWTWFFYSCITALVLSFMGIIGSAALGYI